MQIKYAVMCYVEHWSPGRFLRNEVEFQCEPSHEQIEEALNGVPIYDSDYEDYICKGGMLQGLKILREKCKIKSIYAVVEQRFYREVERSETEFGRSSESEE
jgi:hypothetical protein